MIKIMPGTKIRKLEKLVFVFNATKKNVQVEHNTRKSKATKARRKGTTLNQTNKILSYFTTSWGSQSDQTGFIADSI